VVHQDVAKHTEALLRAAAEAGYGFRAWEPTHLYGNVGIVKTTMDLPDELMIAAKKRAAELRCSLRTLVERGLRHELSVGRPKRTRKKRVIHWVTVRGGLPPGLDLSDRSAMHDWLGRNR
jgi:hypothetical protein